MNKYKKIERRILETVREIRNGENSLYDVASDCLALLKESREYADAIGMNPEDVPGHIEGRFLSDFNVTLSELKAIMSHFPDRDQWDRPLVVLYAEAAAALSLRESEVKSHAKSRRAIKVSEHEAVIRERDDAKAELKHTRDTIIDLNTKLRDLESENAVLRGRIQELERHLHREPVGV